MNLQERNTGITIIVMVDITRRAMNEIAIGIAMIMTADITTTAIIIDGPDRPKELPAR
jgi:hypothetical protein